MSIDAQVTQRTDYSVPEPDGSGEWPIKSSYIIIGVVVALVLFGLLVWGILWAATNYPEAVEAIRDIAIIALALQACLLGLIMVIMLVMIVRLVNMLEFEIKPILEKTNETVGMVRGTTTFVGENVVKPVTRATAFAVGVRRGLKVLFGDPRRNLDG